MKQVVTAKLKLHTTPEQFQALRQTQLAYRDALNAVSRYAYAHGKMSNQQALQRGMYGELRATYHLPVALLQQEAQIGAAKLWYDKPHKQFYLLISLEVAGADPTPHTHTSVAGVDVGVRYLAVTSTTQGACSFHTGKGVVPKANHYARLRKRLQQKGTRSATRRLIAMSGRERRLKQDANHVVAKRIVDQHPHSLIGLEHLTDIRERTKRKTGKQGSLKQRKANTAYSK